MSFEWLKEKILDLGFEGAELFKDFNTHFNKDSISRVLNEHPYFTSLLIGTSALIGHRSAIRFRTARDIPLQYFKKQKTIYAKVMAVNDADNLRVMHIPLTFRLFPIPLLNKRLDLSEQTINIRLAGVDSPEGPHFGKPGQPYFEESKNYLTSLVAHRHVYCRIHRLDQYHRAVCSVYFYQWGFLRKNVSLEMVKAGLAAVYMDTGAEYGNIKNKLLQAEALARKRKLGMWKLLHSGQYESPSEFKKRV